MTLMLTSTIAVFVMSFAFAIVYRPMEQDFSVPKGYRYRRFITWPKWFCFANNNLVNWLKVRVVIDFISFQKEYFLGTHQLLGFRTGFSSTFSITWKVVYKNHDKPWISIDVLRKDGNISTTVHVTELTFEEATNFKLELCSSVANYIVLIGETMVTMSKLNSRDAGFLLYPKLATKSPTGLILQLKPYD